MGPPRHRLVCGATQPPDPALLLPPIRLGSGRLGRLSTGLDRSPQSIRQPSFLLDSPSIAIHPHSTSSGDDVGRSGLGRSVASGSPGAGDRHADDVAGLRCVAADDVGASNTLDVQGTTVDNECLATLRHFLVEIQGLDPSAADVIVRRNWAPGSQSGLNCVWKLWLQHCEQAGITFSSPTVAEFINFLQQVSDGTYRTGAKQGVPTSAGWR